MKNLATAYVQAQQELHNLGKNAQGYGYEYLTLEKLITETRAILAKYGLAILQPMAVTDEGTPAVKTILLHESGEMLEGTYPITAVTLKQANNAQAMGAAISYARRYCLAAMLNIAQADDDAASLTDPKRDEAQALLQSVQSQLRDDQKEWAEKAIAAGQYQHAINGLNQMTTTQTQGTH